MNKLKPIKLLPARERVSSALRKAIICREFKEGEEITLESIAEILGVSTTPVREAFQILSRDGLIRLRPNKGAVVLGINEKSIRDHYELRAILEREVVSIICNKYLDISDILNIYEKGREVVETQSTEKYEEYNQAFHMALWTAAGNSKMKSLLASLWNGLSIGQNVTVEDYAKISINEHEQIVEAIVARDGKKAKTLMNQHILRSMENMLTHYVQNS